MSLMYAESQSIEMIKYILHISEIQYTNLPTRIKTTYLNFPVRPYISLTLYVAGENVVLVVVSLPEFVVQKSATTIKTVKLLSAVPAVKGIFPLLKHSIFSFFPKLDPRKGKYDCQNYSKSAIV